GYVALLVHYFDRTGTKQADKKTIDMHYLTWMGAVNDAVAFAAGMENVDNKRIGLLGFSLGAYVSLSVAASKGKPHVAAVAEYFGGLADLPFNNVKNMPPVLILHGEKDDVVSPEEARKLAALLKKHGVTHEMKLYPNQKHVFTGDDAKDAVERVVKFFE